MSRPRHRRRPSAEAETRWRAAEARYRRGLALASLVMALGIASTWIAAKLEFRVLPLVTVGIAFAAMAWTIMLMAARHREFRRIMIDDGLSAKEAAGENVRRHGG
jgi:hypothetical protein